MYAAINVYELLFSYKQTAQSDKYQNLKYLQHLYGSVQERIKLQLPYTAFRTTIMCINMVLYYTELQINERLSGTHLLYNRKGQQYQTVWLKKEMMKKIQTHNI